MEWTSHESRSRCAELVAAAADALFAFDFDGTLSPIVEDPTQAHAHPEAADALAGLAGRVRAVAVITGRPVRQALELGGLESLADRLGRTELVLLGQYGNERWDSKDRRVVSTDPPPGLDAFIRALPELLAAHDATGAYVEEKGLAVAIHTRRLPDADAGFARLVDPVNRAATEHGLVVEPGRHVLEVRAEGMDKGSALRSLVAELGVAAVLFAGDDLGDVPAFEAVADLRRAGTTALLVCSGSTEEEVLRELADVVVDGPDGVVALLRGVAGRLRG